MRVAEQSQAPRAPAPMLAHVLGLGEALRAHEVPVSVSSMIDLCRSFQMIDIGCPSDVHAAARTILVTRKEHLETFDRVFELYWRGLLSEQTRQKARPREEREGEGDPAQGEERAGRKSVAPSESAAEEGADEGSPEHSEYSPQEALREKDLAALSVPELAEARRIIAELVKRFRSQESRRLIAAREGDRLDVLRMQRRSLPYGLLPFELHYRSRKEKKPWLVLLCDVSGSMERYSSFLVQFICGLREELSRVEIGLFATRLTMVTTALDRLHVERSVRQLSKRVTGWGSGTDIGASLREFNDSAVGRSLRRKATVVILSDGWDRGDVAEMSEQMQRLRRSARRLVWLNPLLGRANYEPLCQGIRAALPYLDDFLPVHNIESLEAAYRLLRGSTH